MTDVTKEVTRATTVLCAILDGVDAKGLLAAGAAWAKTKDELDRASFVTSKKGILFRKAEGFVNHLYRDGRMVVAFNEKLKAVTVSVADPIEGFNCKDFVQSLWGELAGGHAGIAGSPRDRAMTADEAVAAFEKAVETLTRLDAEKDQKFLF